MIYSGSARSVFALICSTSPITRIRRLETVLLFKSIFNPSTILCYPHIQPDPFYKWPRKKYLLLHSSYLSPTTRFLKVSGEYTVLWEEKIASFKRRSAWPYNTHRVSRSIYIETSDCSSVCFSSIEIKKRKLIHLIPFHTRKLARWCLF